MDQKMLVALTLSAVGLTGGCGGRNDVPDEDVSALEVVSVAPTSDSTFRIDDETWLMLTADPVEHLERAMSLYDRLQAPGAGFELRRAAAFIKLDAKRAPAADRGGLEHAAQALHDTGRRLENGQAVYSNHLDRVVAHAYAVLARTHVRLAQEDLHRADAAGVGHHVRLALNELDDGFEVSKHAPSDLARTEMRRAKETLAGLRMASTIPSGAPGALEGLSDAVNTLEDVLVLMPDSET